MDSMFTEDEIIDQIERKRNEMISAGMETGLLSTQTLTASKELDQLLNNFQNEMTTFANK